MVNQVHGEAQTYRDYRYLIDERVRKRRPQSIPNRGSIIIFTNLSISGASIPKPLKIRFAYSFFVSCALSRRVLGIRSFALFFRSVLIYIFRSLESYLATPLNQPFPILFTSCLDPALPTVVYTFGYRGRTNGPATKAVVDAYIKRKKRNVVLLDWEEEAKSGVLGIPLGYALHAVPHAKKVIIVIDLILGVNKTHFHI